MCSNHTGDVRTDETVGVVDCAAPHRFEIVARFEVPEPPDAPFPGVAALQTRIREGCGPLLRARLESALPVAAFYLAPTDESSWTGGNRVFYCGVTTPEQQVDR